MLNPLFDNLLNNGNCPPSNPGLTPPPLLAFCPLCPLPDVFPVPEIPCNITNFVDANADTIDKYENFLKITVCDESQIIFSRIMKKLKENQDINEMEIRNILENKFPN